MTDLTTTETRELLRLALAETRRMRSERDCHEQSAMFWEPLCTSSDDVSRAYSGELQLIAEDLGAEGIGEIRDKIHALIERAKNAEARAAIASETYNGQQQSYRELETLYQAAQERIIKLAEHAKQLHNWALGDYWECESCGARFRRIGPPEAYTSRRCGVCIELEAAHARADHAEFAAEDLPRRLEDTFTRTAALESILKERERQDIKWGEQNNDPFIYITVLAEEVGELAQAALHTRYGGPAAAGLHDEAVHTAAVALAIVECLDRAKWTWGSKEETEPNA